MRRVRMKCETLQNYGVDEFNRGFRWWFLGFGGGRDQPLKGNRYLYLQAIIVKTIGDVNTCL